MEVARDKIQNQIFILKRKILKTPSDPIKLISVTLKLQNNLKRLSLKKESPITVTKINPTFHPTLIWEDLVRKIIKPVLNILPVK